MTNFDRILAEARELLTDEERLMLSFELLPDFAETDPRIDEAWRREVHRRRQRRDSGETQAQAWDEFEDELMSL